MTETHRVYRGRCPCPKCASKETGTNTIATSGRYITFWCDTCGSSFKVRATEVSTLSANLGRLTRGLDSRRT